VNAKFEKLSNSYTFALPFSKRELSSAGSEHLPYKQRVTGSNPVAPTQYRQGFQRISETLSFCHLHTVCIQEGAVSGYKAVKRSGLSHNNQSFKFAKGRFPYLATNDFISSASMSLGSA
jgi:hypothetical protein